MQILKLKLADIDASDRLREVNPEKVRELLPSWLSQGQMMPIEVRAADEEGKFKLVSGGHRVAVARAAGEETIFATLFDGGDDESRLREIDENLYRAELSPYDQAAFLAERRAIYERLNGRVKAGPKGARSSRQAGANYDSGAVQLSFFDETTKKFGLPKRTIIRALTRHSRIDSRAWAALRGTSFCNKGADLDALGKLEPATQWKVAQHLRSGAFANVKAAIRSVIGAPAAPGEKTVVEKLTTLWAKATDAEKRRFLAHLTDVGAIGG
jgi:ParB family chromosome partitioning protein